MPQRIRDGIIGKVLGILVLLMVGVGFFVETHSEDTTIACVPVAERERIRVVVLEGIDEALKQHVMKLFDIWMKDTSKQPERAIEGMSIGISAHVRARANATRWDPPPC
jgi:hypothetical protein